MSRVSLISFRHVLQRPLARAAWPALVLTGFVGSMLIPTWGSASRAAESTVVDDNGDMARKADIMHGPQWQRAITELGGWLSTQTLYSPNEVRRIKMQFNDRVDGMTSYELEYLLDSITAKLQLFETLEARDAKAWLGEYLSAMSDGRRAQALREVPNLLDMNAAQLWQEIQRIDAKRSALRQRQQGVEARQGAMAERAAAGRRATSAASRDAAARARAAPSHSPYRAGGGSPPFSDIAPRRATINVGPFGACVSF
jgi:erythromycin esterase-like protein